MSTVLIAGSGVAAVEAVLALRLLANRRLEIDLLAPAHALEHRPASVATPFGLGAPPPLDLHELARRYDVTLVAGELAGVDVEAGRAHLATGDERGFLPTDAHGRVAPGVLAAGDATDFPIKQGGLATQQADAAAASIAGRPQPFKPVLRGLLLTGGAPLYLRAEGATCQVSWHPLWAPPGKVAGRYLAPYLSTARPVALGDEPLVDRI